VGAARAAAWLMEDAHVVCATILDHLAHERARTCGKSDPPSIAFGNTVHGRHAIARARLDRRDSDEVRVIENKVRVDR
jgi:hypothetical protein